MRDYFNRRNEALFECSQCVTECNKCSEWTPAFRMLRILTCWRVERVDRLELYGYVDHLAFCCTENEIRPVGISQILLNLRLDAFFLFNSMQKFFLNASMPVL